MNAIPAATPPGDAGIAPCRTHRPDRAPVHPGRDRTEPARGTQLRLVQGVPPRTPPLRLVNGVTSAAPAPSPSDLPRSSPDARPRPAPSGPRSVPSEQRSAPAAAPRSAPAAAPRSAARSAPLRSAQQAPLRLTRRGRVVLAVVAALAVAGLSLLAASAAQATNQPAPSRQNLVQVVVRPGQNLWSVAESADPDQDTRMVIKQIIDLNSLSSDTVFGGQQLWVPRD